MGRATKVMLEGEMDSHLGYHKHDLAGDGSGNSGNGHRAKAVAKGQRRPAQVDDWVISLVAKGLTTAEVQAQMAEIYGERVSRATINKITERVLEGMAEWCGRPLDRVYAVLFLDAIHVKVRDGQVAGLPVHVATGVTADGERDILGLWAGAQGDGEGTRYWLRLLTEIKSRGTGDVLMAVCDGLKGFPAAVSQVWPAAITQTCIVHLLRNSFRYASKRDWAAIAGDLEPVYTAATEAEARERFADFSDTWEAKYPPIVRLWEDSWPEFVPFLTFDRDIKRVIITTTDAIDSMNARFRRGVEARGHFRTEQAALRFLYVVIMSVDPTGQGRQRRSHRWEAALRAFNITFDGRLRVTRTYPARPRWWKLALGVAIVLVIALWDAGIPGQQTQLTGDGTGATPPAHIAAVAADPGVIQPKGEPEFSATFTGSRLDTSVWATCYPAMDLPTGCRNFGNREYEWYLPSQVQVSGGMLHLDALQTPTAGEAQDGSTAEYACRSGMVTSYPGFRFRYGYLQVVARIPASAGLWPALWLAAADLHWPPEIDILEAWGGTSVYSAAYFHPVGAKQDKAVIPPKLAIGWHIFALSWTKTQLTWLLDGKVIFTVRQRVPQQKMYFIADLAEARSPIHAAQCNGSLLIRSVMVWKN